MPIGEMISLAPYNPGAESFVGGEFNPNNRVQELDPYTRRHLAIARKYLSDFWVHVDTFYKGLDLAFIFEQTQANNILNLIGNGHKRLSRKSSFCIDADRVLVFYDRRVEKGYGEIYSPNVLIWLVQFTKENF